MRSHHSHPCIFSLSLSFSHTHTPYRITCYAANALNFMFVYRLLSGCRTFALNTLGLSVGQAVGYGAAATLGITSCLYVHFTYIVDALDRAKTRNEGRVKRD